MWNCTLVITWSWLLICTPSWTAAGDSEKDLASLQGTWEIVSMEVEGEKVPFEAIKGITAVFKKDLLTVRSGDHTDEQLITLDASKTPKWFNLTGGGRVDTLALGIYKIEGNKFTLCTSKKENDRPKEFVTKKGDGHGLLVFKKKS